MIHNLSPKFPTRLQVGCTMEKEVRRLKKINLALAVAEGESIAAWARQNGVPERTALRWAQDRNVRREVDACRRRALNQAIGRLTGMAMNAVDGIANLAQRGRLRVGSAQGVAGRPGRPDVRLQVLSSLRFGRGTSRLSPWGCMGYGEFFRVDPSLSSGTDGIPPNQDWRLRGVFPLWSALSPGLLPYALAFSSSFCIMILELVSSRLVAQHVGASLTVWTSVIGIILGGICLGNVLGGRLADRTQPRRVVGPLFALGSFLTLGCLWVNAEIGRIMPAPESLNWELRTVIVVILDFLVPATVLGMVGPVVAKMAVEQSKRTGSAIGDVYFCGAIGSIVGTFMAGFVLMPLAFTSTMVILVAAALAFLAACLSGRGAVQVLALLTALLLATGSIGPVARLLGSGGLDLGAYRLNYITLAGSLTALLMAAAAIGRLLAARRDDLALEGKAADAVASARSDLAPAQPVRSRRAGVPGQPRLHGPGDGRRPAGDAAPGIEHLRLDQRHRRAACRTEPGQLPGRANRQLHQEREAGELALPGRVGSHALDLADGNATEVAARSARPGPAEERAQHRDHAGPSSSCRSFRPSR